MERISEVTYVEEKTPYYIVLDGINFGMGVKDPTGLNAVIAEGGWISRKDYPVASDLIASVTNQRRFVRIPKPSYEIFAYRLWNFIAKLMMFSSAGVRLYRTNLVENPNYNPTHVKLPHWKDMDCNTYNVLTLHELMDL